MPEFFSSDGNVILQFLAIFSFIVVAMGAVYLIYRRFVGRGLSLAARAGDRSRQPRLGIVDIYELDRQRQLILLRRDNVEHLLLVGGPNDVVVERNVQRGAGARSTSEGSVRPEPVPDSSTESPADRAPAGHPPLAPSFEMPVVVSQPLPGSDRQPDPGAPPLDAALFEAEPSESRAGEPVTPRGRAGRILRRTPPPLANPRPDAASARRQTAPEPPAAAPDAAPPPMPSGATRNVDPAILSDMARQLEVALRRPSSAVTPPPGQATSMPETPQVASAAESAAEPAAVAPVAAASEAPRPEPTRLPDPVAAGMAASQVLNPSPTPPSPAAEPPPAAETSPTASPEPIAPKEAPPASPPIAARPAPPASEARAAPAAPPSNEPEAAPQAVAPGAKPEPTAGAAAPNPFSVEEIEAEFARLLGRPLDRRN